MLKQHTVSQVACGLATSFALLACCSCSDDGRRPVFPVSGSVSYLGKPTPDALIIFHPQNDPDPLAPHPMTRIKEDGTFSLFTYNMDDGAPAGEYIVTVTWVKETDNQNAPKEDVRPAKNLVPERYATVESSDLKVTIKEEANKLPPFILTKN